jgi:hypothetical protein
MRWRWMDIVAIINKIPSYPLSPPTVVVVTREKVAWYTKVIRRDETIALTKELSEEELRAVCYDIKEGDRTVGGLRIIVFLIDADFVKSLCQPVSVQG